MKNNVILPLLMIGILFGSTTGLHSCKKISKTVPSVTTTATSQITASTATSGGNVTVDGGSGVISRGVCWSVSPSPVVSGNKTADSLGTGIFISRITGLAENTKYYIRAYATNSEGTGYGNEITFTTLPGGGTTVTDIDGNVYHTVIIGKQTWCIENLKVTRYGKGDSIPDVPDASAWSLLTKGARSSYDKNPDHVATYGYLYNWYVLGDSLGICPEGYHAATESDWQTLFDFLGGLSVAGGKLKSTGTLEAGTGLWRDPNTGATNESGFFALPGGFRTGDGQFQLLSTYAYFWSSTEDPDADGWGNTLNNKYGNAERAGFSKRSGMSVRCVKN